MKKFLSIALLLLSIAAPSATYSVEEEAPHNVQKTSTSTTIEAKKADNLKPATLKRRFCASFLSLAMVGVEGIIYARICNIEMDKNTVYKLASDWRFMVIFYVTFFSLDLFSKYLLGMKVVDISGKDASWIQLLIRCMVRFPALFFYPFFSGASEKVKKGGKWANGLVGVIQVIVLLARKDGRILQDLVAKTIVVMRDESTAAAQK